MYLTYAQIGISILLVISILLQQRGGGLSGAITGGSNMEYSTKRGAEKFIFYATIVLAIAFVGVSVARLLL